MQDRLPTSVKFGWGMGSIGPISMMYLTSFFAVVFMATYLGISPTIAGLIILLTKIFNMFTDPLVGILSDRINTSWGRRRPFMLAGGIAGGLACIFFFNVPVFENINVTIGYMALVTVLYFTAYTAFNVPYLAMPAEMTQSPDERTSIMTWRVFFVSVAGYVGLAFAPFLVWVGGQDREAYEFMSWVMGALLFAAMAYAVYATRRATFTTYESPQHSLKEQIATALGNKPFVNITIAKLLQLLGLSTTTAALPFVALYLIGGDFWLLTIYGLSLNTASILIISLWRKASKAIEKKHLYVIAITGYALCGMTWWFTGTDELTPLATLQWSEDISFTIPSLAYVVRCAGLGIFTAGVLLLGQSMVPDAIAYDYVRTGLRREGMFSAIYSFVEKMALAIGPLILGIVLDMNGFITSSQGVVEQPDSAINAIYIGIAVIPPLAALASIPFLLMYDLTDEKLQNVNAS